MIAIKIELDIMHENAGNIDLQIPYERSWLIQKLEGAFIFQLQMHGSLTGMWIIKKN